MGGVEAGGSFLLLVFCSRLAKVCHSRTVMFSFALTSANVVEAGAVSGVEYKALCPSPTSSFSFHSSLFVLDFDNGWVLLLSPELTNLRRVLELQSPT
jgi:hypothetical protein